MTRGQSIIVVSLALVLCVAPSVAYASQSSKSQNAIANAQAQASKSVESASEKVTSIQNKASSTSLKVRQEVCEQKRTRLQTASKTMYQGAESVKKSLDTAYERVVGFYDNGQLTVADYQQYINKIELAKQDATAAMAALQLRENSDIDCADAKTASRLEGDRLAGEGTKTALKQYRTELVNLMSALSSVTTSEEKTNE